MKSILHSRAIQRLAAKLGYFNGTTDASLATAKIALRVAHEVLLRRVLSDYAIDCVIDVGANRGQFGRMIRNAGYTGPLVSFEPIQEQFEVLRDIALGDSMWQVRNEAVGDADGTIALHIMERSEFSSVLLPSESQPAQFSKRNAIMETRNVPLRRLDSVCEQIPVLVSSKRILLKIDTQGADLAVFRGASGIVERIAAIQTELAAVPIYEGMPNMGECQSFYDRAGFTPTSLVPVSREDGTLAVVEFDCLLVARSKSPVRENHYATSVSGSRSCATSITTP